MKKEFPFPLNPEDKTELEAKLKEARRRFADLEYDDRNGTYPAGVPPEVIEEAKEVVEKLEDAVRDLEKPME